MTRVKIPYYTVRRNGRGFGSRGRTCALGFRSIACGLDGPDAWAVAEEWNGRWLVTWKQGAPSPAMVAADNLSPERSDELTYYPARSLGEAFKRYRRTDEWARKAPRTREDWWRGWRRIKPIFGVCNPRTVSLEDISAWRAAGDRRGRRPSAWWGTLLDV